MILSEGVESLRIFFFGVLGEKGIGEFLSELLELLVGAVELLIDGLVEPEDLVFDGHALSEIDIVEVEDGRRIAHDGLISLDGLRVLAMDLAFEETEDPDLVV